MRLGPDDDVVHEGRHSLVTGILKVVVNHTLECRRCIAESQRHDSVFEMAVSATECCLPYVSFLDSDEMVAVFVVNFIEVFPSSNSFLQLIHVGEGVMIWASNRVDCFLVNA